MARLLPLLLLLPTAAFAQRVTVMVELQSPSAVETYLAASGKIAATTAARNELAVVEAEQQPIAARLAAMNGTNVIYRIQRLMNGIAIDTDASQLDAIAKMPGVKRILPIPLVTLDNTSSVPLIGAPDVWKSLTNRAIGQNVKVGVIDTGIDYLHSDFGGSGIYPNVPHTGATIAWTNKVVGGTDLAGDNYDAGSADPKKRTPVPDPDPMDCAGHGSHVAGTIAGYGVLKNGNTYTGAYDTIDESQFLIGPGVAPGAQLYAIRIFGCSGSTSLVAKGLEWALDPNGDGDFSDRMDVVNLSLGSPFGDQFNSDTVVANRLASAGVVVVASAGNSGDTYYITGTPASADRAISVASSVDALEPADGLRIEPPSSIAGDYVAHASVNFPWLTMAAPVKGALAYPPAQRTGCAAFDPTNAAAISGKVALLDWTDNDCGSKQRVDNAHLAGAIGVVLRYPRPFLDIAIAGSDNIPSTIVASDTGSLIDANLADGITVTFSKDLLGTQRVIIDAQTDTLSTFTAHGPRTGDNAIKPEITAPGQSIFSVRALSGTLGISLNGTSMASPHVAGAMALLKELHRDWTVEELKALAMNTAGHDLFTGNSHSGSRYAVSRIGAGRVDVASASRATAIAFNGDVHGVVGVSFGALEVVGSLQVDRNIEVENKSANPMTFDVTYDAVVDQPGVAFSFPNGNSITVPPHGAIEFPLRLTATATGMRHHRDPSLTPTQNSVTRHWIPEASGYVTLASAGAETLRVPVLAVPRAASTMHAVEKTLPAARTMTLHLAGTPVLSSNHDLEDEYSLVSAFELTDTPMAAIVSPGIVRYVGITTDYAAQKAAGKGVADSTIYLAIATSGNWATPQETTFHVDLDTNGDGIDDMRLTLGDLGTFTTPSADDSDVFIAQVCTELGTNCKRQYVNKVDASIIDTVPFNTNVIVLPVRAADLGLRDGASRFTYRVSTGSVDTSAIRHSYDVAAPGLSFTSPSPAPFGFADLPNNTISMTYDSVAFGNAGSKGVLLLHHHNASGAHTEIVTIGPANGKHRAAGK